MPRTTLPLALRKRLQSVATAVRKPKSAVLVRAGQACRGAFLLRSGRVELSLEGASHLYPARIVGTGSVIGLPAAFSGEPYRQRLKPRPTAVLISFRVENCSTSFGATRGLASTLCAC